MRRATVIAVPVLLLCGPTVLAFASGGYFTAGRLVALVVACLLLAATILTADRDAFTLTSRVKASRSRATVAHPATSGPDPAPPADVARSRGRRAIVLAIGGLALLAGWTALSRLWAPLDAAATDALERTLLYLVVLAAATLAFAPRRIAVWVEPALAAGTVIVVGYAVLGHVGVIDVTQTRSAGGRLDQPLTYWNAQGALAAMGFVLLARLAGSRERPLGLRVAAAGAAPLLGVATYLTFSRGALTALAVGLAVLLALTPTWTQLRAVAIALEGAALAVVAFEVLPDGIALVALIALGLVGAAAQAWSANAESEESARTGPLPATGRVRAGAWIAAGILALAPFAAAVIDRDSPGDPAFGATAERLSSAGSDRFGYWDVALRTFADDPAIGVGAGGFAAAWLERRDADESVRDAHSLVLETAAELGLVGLALLAVVLAGVLGGVRRALDADPALAAGPAAALAVWAAHASIDWDWEMPALTLVAALLAGLLLARGYHRAPS